jgi:hypothetical protein
MGMHWATGLSPRTASDPIGAIGDSRLALTKNDTLLKIAIFRRVSNVRKSQHVMTRAARLWCARGLDGSGAHFG